MINAPDPNGDDENNQQSSAVPKASKRAKLASIRAESPAATEAEAADTLTTQECAAAVAETRLKHQARLTLDKNRHIAEIRKQRDDAIDERNSSLKKCEGLSESLGVIREKYAALREIVKFDRGITLYGSAAAALGAILVAITSFYEKKTQFLVAGFWIGITLSVVGSIASWGLHKFLVKENSTK